MPSLPEASKLCIAVLGYGKLLSVDLAAMSIEAPHINGMVNRGAFGAGQGGDMPSEW